MQRLILLSGWGCDARLWQALDGHWPDALTIRTPDWPGYGQRPELDDPTSLTELADAMRVELPADAIWVGWSLGGLLATALLDHLPAPRALVLLGMGDGLIHPEGVSRSALTRFQQAFERHPAAALTSFHRWQLSGEPSPREAYRQLRDILGEALPATPNTLRAGLAQLSRIDNARRLAQPPCPVQRIIGDRDPLMAPHVRDNADHRLSDCGHCPPLGQPQQLVDTLTRIAATHDIRAPEKRLEIPT